MAWRRIIGARHPRSDRGGSAAGREYHPAVAPSRRGPGSTRWRCGRASTRIMRGRPRPDATSPDHDDDPHEHEGSRPLATETSPLTDRSILVTGGTGSFGKRFVRTVLAEHKPRRVVIFSRDELKQYEIAAGPRQRPARPLLHRRRPRPRPAVARLRRRRHRRPRRGAQAGAGRRVQPVRGDQDQHPSAPRTSSTRRSIAASNGSSR